MQKYTIEEGKRPKVALAAVASNESAYLAEWIHHHLYFGVDLIDITVNRSTDVSESVLQAICGADPRVQVFNGDSLVADVPGAGNIQVAGYKAARRRLRGQLGAADYVLFLDIDEFWTPADFKTGVGAVLEQAGLPAIAGFNWFSVLSDKRLFEQTFSGLLSGLMDAHVKTASRLGLWLRGVSAHTVQPVFPLKRWAASGLGFQRGGSATVCEPDEIPQAFVAHRLYRSPLEYIALLGRGRPIGDGKLFKSNRVGYRLADDHLQWQHRFEATPKRLADYEASYAEFVARAGISGLLAEARMSVLARAEQVVETYDAQPPDVQADWAFIFENLDLESFARDLAAARAEITP